MGLSKRIDEYFGVTSNGSTIRTEFQGAVLVFLSIFYLMTIIPSILSSSGMDYSQAFTATVIVSIVGCLLMGFYAKYPIFQGPGVGICTFFSYSVVLMMGYTWQEAMAAMFISAAIFLLLSFTGIRKKVIESIPDGLRLGICAGVGLFIAFVGLVDSGIITHGAGSILSLGELTDVTVLTSLFCIFITLFLYSMRVPAAVFIGIISTVVFGILVGSISIPSELFELPAMPEAGSFISGIDGGFFDVRMIFIIFCMVVVQFFEGTASIFAVNEALRKENDEKDFGMALKADAVSATVSAAVGSTPTTSFVESVIGINRGARTGLMPVFVAVFLLVSLFIGPIFMMGSFQCTVGAMLIIGISTFTDLRKIDWDDMPVVISVTVTVVFMIVAYSIADGLALGVITYCVCMVGARRFKEISPVMYGLAVTLALYLVFNYLML